MSEMVERVAKAIHEKHTNPDDNQHWFHEDASKCELSRQLARAAIEAMREPTAAMWKSNQPTWSLGRPMWEWWRDMIDAALHDPRP